MSNTAKGFRVLSFTAVSVNCVNSPCENTEMTDLATPLPTGVYLRPGSSVYQLRIGVPKELQHLTCYRDAKTGKPRSDAFRGSLRTSSRDEAVTRALKLLAEYRDRFALQRASNSPPPLVVMTSELARQFAHEARRQFLLADDHTTFYEPDRASKALAHKVLKRTYTARTKALRHGDLQPARAFAERLAESWGFRVEWASPEGTACLIRIARAMVVAGEDVFKRRQGKAIETPPAQPPITTLAKTPIEPAKPLLTLRDVLPYWVIRNAPTEVSARRANKALSLFEDAVGKIPLPDLAKATGARFVQYLLDSKARGFGRKTADNHASYINALVTVAVQEDLLPKNPFNLRFDKTIGAKTRTPWTDEELKRIHAHALFSSRMTEVTQWHKVEPRDGRAALLLLLHTGARDGEIGQLRREDFQIRSGITAIRITAEAGTLKTAESERIIPLAPHLLDDPWFSEWLSETMGGTGPALPSLCGRARGAGDTFGQWFRQFRNDVGLPKGALEGAHKFRHWLRTALAEAGVNAETADAITGHAATGSSGRRIYTAAASLPTMVEALDRVKWPD